MVRKTNVEKAKAAVKAYSPRIYKTGVQGVRAVATANRALTSESAFRTSVSDAVDSVLDQARNIPLAIPDAARARPEIRRIFESAAFEIKKRIVGDTEVQDICLSRATRIQANDDNHVRSLCTALKAEPTVTSMGLQDAVAAIAENSARTGVGLVTIPHREALFNHMMTGVETKVGLNPPNVPQVAADILGRMEVTALANAVLVAQPESEAAEFRRELSHQAAARVLEEDETLLGNPNIVDLGPVLLRVFTAKLRALYNV